MYLEDRIRALEERIVSLENHARPNDNRELIERIDGIEGTCHDLINGDDALRGRCNEFDRRLNGLAKQLEEMLEQMAELDGRSNRPDTSPLENRIRQLESDLQSLRGLRNDVNERIAELDRGVGKNRSRIEELDAMGKSIKERLAQLDLGPLGKRLGLLESAMDPIRALGQQLDSLSADVRRRLEELLARLDRAEHASRELDLRHTAIERETLPTRVRDLEQGTAHRLDVVERDAGDTRKEVAWLRDRPQGNRFDNLARFIGAGGLAAGIVAMILFLWPQDTIRAQRFLVVDKQDRQLASFTSNDKGASLELQDHDGRRRMVMAAASDGSMMSLLDGSGSERARVATDASIGTGLVVFEQGGRQRLWCGMAARPALYLFDEAGNVRGSMAVEPSGPELALFETNRQPRVRLVTGKNDNGLRVYDAGGRMRVGVGMCPEGAAVNLFDPAEQRRVVLSSNQDATALAFLGAKEVQRTTLGMTKDDESILNLHDGEGKQRILLFASDKDAGVQVLDRETNVLFSGP